MPQITHFYIGNKSKNKKYVIVLILILIIVYLFNYMIRKNFYPVVIEFAASQTEYIGETIINTVVLDYIESNNISYEKLYRINKNNAGDIISIEANTYEMNKLKSQLTLSIQQKINSSDDMYISVPIFCIFGSVFLSDIGPSIDISLLLSGDNETELISEFKSVGINQTKHDVYIEFEYKIKALIPGERAETTANCKVPIISTIILGDVPETTVNVNRNND